VSEEDEQKEEEEDEEEAACDELELTSIRARRVTVKL
jgi:hypothetical protein